MAEAPPDEDGYESLPEDDPDAPARMAAEAAEAAAAAEADADSEPDADAEPVLDDADPNNGVDVPDFEADANAPADAAEIPAPDDQAWQEMPDDMIAPLSLSTQMRMGIADPSPPYDQPSQAAAESEAEEKDDTDVVQHGQGEDYGDYEPPVRRSSAMDVVPTQRPHRSARVQSSSSAAAASMNQFGAAAAVFREVGDAALSGEPESAQDALGRSSLCPNHMDAKEMSATPIVLDDWHALDWHRARARGRLVAALASWAEFTVAAADFTHRAHRATFTVPGSPLVYPVIEDRFLAEVGAVARAALQNRANDASRRSSDRSPLVVASFEFEQAKLDADRAEKRRRLEAGLDLANGMRPNVRRAPVKGKR